MRATKSLLFPSAIALAFLLSSPSCSSCRHPTGSPQSAGAGARAASVTAANAGTAVPAAAPLATKSYSVTAKSKNQAVEFSIPAFTVTGALGANTAPPGKSYLVVDTVWKNIIPLTKVAKNQDDAAGTNGAGGLGFAGGRPAKKENPGDYEMRPTPYVVPDVKLHAFVVINGEDTVTLSDAQPAAAHPLSLEQIVVPKLNAEVRGQLVYEIPASGVSSLLFRFLDTSMGSFDVQLYGEAPRPATSIAGPVKNDVLEICAYGIEEVSNLAGKPADGTDKYAVVQLGLTGKAEGSLVQAEVENYAYLRDPQGTTFTPAKDVSAPGQFKGTVQLLPGTLQRGSLVFAVPEQHGPLTLVLTLPGYAALELNLPNSATGGGSPAASAPPVLFTVSDGETLDMQVHGARLAPNLGEAQPESGKQFLVLDLTLVNKVDQGIEFQTGEQVKLLNGDEEIEADSAAMESLAHPLSEGSVVPAHGRSRFEVAYQVPSDASKLVLYYRGFNREEKHPLAMR